MSPKKPAMPPVPVTTRPPNVPSVKVPPATLPVMPPPTKVPPVPVTEPRRTGVTPVPMPVRPGMERENRGRVQQRYASGGSVSSRADGCAQRGKTKGRII